MGERTDIELEVGGSRRPDEMTNVNSRFPKIDAWYKK
jgi:hypothetical protein